MTRHRKRIRTSESVQQRAKELRQQSTAAEQVLWDRLRNRQLGGLTFRRQHPLGPLIADFCCPACRLIVEIDGGIHDLRGQRDTARTEQFQQHGYQVIRFKNDQVLNDIEGVLAAIEATASALVNESNDTA